MSVRGDMGMPQRGVENMSIPQKAAMTANLVGSRSLFGGGLISKEEGARTLDKLQTEVLKSGDAKEIKAFKEVKADFSKKYGEIDGNGVFQKAVKPQASPLNITKPFTQICSTIYKGLTSAFSGGSSKSEGKSDSKSAKNDQTVGNKKGGIDLSGIGKGQQGSIFDDFAKEEPKIGAHHHHHKHGTETPKAKDDEVEIGLFKPKAAPQKFNLSGNVGVNYDNEFLNDKSAITPKKPIGNINQSNAKIEVKNRSPEELKGIMLPIENKINAGVIPTSEELKQFDAEFEKLSFHDQKQILSDLVGAMKINANPALISEIMGKSTGIKEFMNKYMNLSPEYMQLFEKYPAYTSLAEDKKGAGQNFNDLFVNPNGKFALNIKADVKSGFENALKNDNAAALHSAMDKVFLGALDLLQINLWAQKLQ